MKRDPVCGMTGVIERHGSWFCSERCAAEYARRLAGQGPHEEADASCRADRPAYRSGRPAGAWWRDPWVWVPVTGAALIALRWSPRAARISDIYLGYVEKMFLPLLAGLLIGGLVDHFVPKAYIVKLLSGPRKRVILRATLLGFLASSCSHGCLALTIELYRKGASIPAAVSFLLASPWASMSLTLILISLFGLKGIAIITGALGIAFATGLIFQRLALRGLIESNPNTPTAQEDFSVWRDLASRWRQYSWTRQQFARDARGVLEGMMPLGRMVLGWVQLGLALSAILGGLVPHEMFERFLGPSIGGLLLTLVVATVVEVCSEGTAPLAFEFYRHTGALGNSFAFLMGGVVTDYTELGALWANIGRRTVLWLLLVTLPMVLAVGLVLNFWTAH